ncbi:MAG: hypothetical protein A2V88_09005 [Elusimicrobia bacterium RBG_16_66_12]|nr:MAG: hypothetical protein A2V88_09005 [Elusimicrobia bacterium RBG_16_66_12]
MSAPALFLVLLAASSASAESFKSWAARASREEREKDDSAAARSYSNALSSWKESDGRLARAKVFCARGALMEKAGADAEAIKDYSECLATDAKNAKVFHRRGLLRLKSGGTALAIDDFYQAVKADVRFAQAYADRGRAYASQGEKDFAREDHQRACELGVKASCADRKRKTAAASDPPEPKTAARPRFSDCLRGLERCAEAGRAFGPCIDAAPSCAKKAVKGCCPDACRGAYRRELDRGLSEAAAYREVFAPGAKCATAP